MATMAYSASLSCTCVGYKMIDVFTSNASRVILSSDKFDEIF